jgi:3-hydroxyacyl-[acyl-carrier-protein] dehydratase
MVAINKKRIGIKYCGGCNPYYERVDVIQKVHSLVKNRFLFLGHHQKKLDGLILGSGCPRACATTNLGQTEVPLRSVVKETEFESLIDWLTTLDGSGKI